MDLYRRGANGAAVDTHIAIGAPARVDSIDGYFARAAGVDATFVVPKNAVNAVLDAW